MIENPKTLTEQLLNLVERIATEMRALFATIETKQDAGDYATNESLTSGLAGKANTAHSHEISAVNGLQTALDSKQAAGDYLTKTTADGYYLGKSEKAASAGSADTATKATQDASGNTITETYATKTELAGKQPTGDYLTTSAASAAYAAKSHTHTTADVSGLDTALAGKADASHTHEISAVNGLQTALDSKQPAGSYSVTGHTHTKAEITDFPTLATVATSGNYNDLTDKPTIPEPVDVSGLVPKTGNAGTVSVFTNAELHEYEYAYVGGDGDDQTISININSAETVIYRQYVGSVATYAPALSNTVTFAITKAGFSQSAIKVLHISDESGALGSIKFSGDGVVVDSSAAEGTDFSIQFIGGSVIVRGVTPQTE